MVRLALLPAAFLLSLGAASAAPTHLGPPALAAGLSARAGVGGVARPGRWLPVEIRVSGAQAGVHGVLRVEWGDAVVLRDVDVAPGAEQRLTVLIRAVAAGPTVHVAITGSATTSTIDVPVELAPLEAPLTLCIGDTGTASCSVRVAEDEAPTAWRGYDAADTVVWPASDRSTRRDAVRAAATWRAMRWLGDAGPSDPVLPSFDRRTPSVTSVTIRLVAVSVAITLLAAIGVWMRAHIALALGIPIVMGAASGALLLNPALFGQRDVTSVQMTGVVHQFAETPSATFSAKADLEHPNAARLWLRPDLADVTLGTRGPGNIRSISVEDRDGRGLYRAAAGLGAHTRITMDGTIDATWLDITESGTERTVTNRAAFTLSNCTWRGDATEHIGTLLPSSRLVLNPGRAPSSGDTIVCTLPNEWLAWSTSGPRVDTRGQTYFVFHFWPAPPEQSHATR